MVAAGGPAKSRDLGQTNQSTPGRDARNRSPPGPSGVVQGGLRQVGKAFEEARPRNTIRDRSLCRLWLSPSWTRTHCRTLPSATRLVRPAGSYAKSSKTTESLEVRTPRFAPLPSGLIRLRDLEMQVPGAMVAVSTQVLMPPIAHRRHLYYESLYKSRTVL